MWIQKSPWSNALRFAESNGHVFFLSLSQCFALDHMNKCCVKVENAITCLGTMHPGLCFPGKEWMNSKSEQSFKLLEISFF